MKLFLNIEKISHINSRTLLKKLNKKKYFLSPWIISIFKKKKNIDVDRCVLYKIQLKKDLKINKPTQLIEVYKKLKKSGFELVEPEISLIVRLKIKNQKPGTWYRFATPLKSMIDDDGIPHLPKIGCGLGRLCLETYWAYKNAVFYPHNYFIVKKIEYETKSKIRK